MNRSAFGGKSGEIDSSPGVESLHHGTSEGSEIHADDRGSRGRGKSRKNRIIFNAAQLNALEKLFQEIPYPDIKLRMKIAERLDIDEGRITVWFQNRRAKYRRVTGKTNTDGSVPAQSPQVNSPASISTQDQFNAECALYTPSAGGQNFVHTVPLSGVEYSTWVHHSHSGDKSTVVHQSHDQDRTQCPDNQHRNGIPEAEVSSQKKTLDWLQTQPSPQAVSPYSIANSSPQTPAVNHGHHHQYNNQQDHTGDYVSPPDVFQSHPGHPKVSSYLETAFNNGSNVGPVYPHGVPPQLSRNNSVESSPGVPPTSGEQRTAPMNNQFDQPNSATAPNRTAGAVASVPPNNSVRPNLPVQNGHRDETHAHYMGYWQTPVPKEVVYGRIQEPFNNRTSGGRPSHPPGSTNAVSNLPPNRDVKELHQNHLGEALLRLSASQSYLMPPAHAPIAPNPLQSFSTAPTPHENGGHPNLHRHGIPHVSELDRLNYSSIGTNEHSQSQYHPQNTQTQSNNPHQERKNEFLYPSVPRQNGIMNTTENPRQVPPSQDSRFTSNPKRQDRREQQPTHVNDSSNTKSDAPTRKRRIRHSSTDSCDRKPREEVQRRKRFRKRRKIRRVELPAKEDLPLSELSTMRRRSVINSDSEDDAVSKRRQIRRTTNHAPNSVRRPNSSGEDAAVSSRSERRSSSSTIFSSTSDSDFESPYCKKVKMKKRPGNHKMSSGPVFHSSLSDKRQDISGNPRAQRVVGVFDINKRKTYLEINGNSGEGRKEERIRQNYTKEDSKTQITDSESASLLNFFFGPKTPDIPLDNDASDEEPKSVKEVKSQNEDIVSESLQVAQMCGSPASPNHPEQRRSYDQRPVSLPFGQLGESGNSVGQVVAYHRDMYHPSQGPYTIHYGNGVAPPLGKLQAKPRGIIRPVPQRAGGPSPHGGGVQKITSSDSAGGVDQSHSARPTGTVRPWCDDLPKATANPEQDISRPVREPVPMDGAPPNKVCTMVKDALSPVDLLAKYLTWTGSCYISQNRYQQSMPN